MIGTNLSHYKIVSELGRGGMGIVYKAEDSKLNRTVALKVLPASALSNDDDRARFLREAQAAAQLNHSHIATVYEIDEAAPRAARKITRGEIDEAVPEGSSGDDLRPFIAMEYIDGETLTEFIAKGPVKLETAIRIAKEVASALQAAHDKKIVHRDVKSGNVMLAEKGKAIVLDFGLAKTAQSTMLTQLGSTLGTIAYMSPEQARSEEVDQRTDLWALGVLLYEMVAGSLPFGGDYEQAIVYSILNEDPAPLTSLRTGVPMEIERIVEKCLTRDQDLRYRSADDIAVDLARVDVKKSSRPSVAIESAPDVTSADVIPNTHSRTRMTIAASVLFGLVIGAAGMWLSRESGSNSEARLPLQFSIDISPYVNMQFPAISADARYLAFVASDSSDAPRSIRVRDMTTGEIVSIPNSDGARRLSFSPDGRWLLFGTATDVRKVQIPGGTPTVLVNAAFAMATWGLNGAVIYESDGPIRILEEGAVEATVLIEPDSLLNERLLDHPYRYGSTLLFTSVRRASSSVGVLDLVTGEKEYILENASRARYTASGHLIYNRLFATEQLMARPYDLNDRRSLGAEVPVVDASLNGLYDFSAGGILVHGNFELLTQTGGFTVVDQSGAELARLPIPARSREHPSISPDRALLAISEYVGESNLRDSNSRIWLYDMTNWSSMPVSSVDRPAVMPVIRNQSLYYLRPSESNLPAGFFLSPTSSDECEVVSVPRSGPFDPTVIVDSVYCQSTFDVAMDESSLVFVRRGQDESTPVAVVVHAFDDGTETEIWSGLVTRTSMRLAMNPSSEFVAIDAPVANRSQLFVMKSDGLGPWIISDGKVDALNWSEDDSRIYYARGRSLYQVAVSTSGGFRTIDQASILFTRSVPITGFAPQPERNAIYLTDLGDRIDTAESVGSIKVTVNWFEELKSKAPVTGVR
ncbi:MAG: hypothetical protein BMS9Abin05_1035 [Rhodothermia bacterium]|nr:MAG: hypothetical protein BMS9Abin05_1035 [Rhodothermia bacterium]